MQRHRFPPATRTDWSRRRFLSLFRGSVTTIAIGATSTSIARPNDAVEPFFQTRGVILRPSDIQTWTWPEKAKTAGLTTIGTHIFPSEVATFVGTEAGQKFLESCRELGLEVEHELHAVEDLLPRKLFARNPEMFRMDGDGNRTPRSNLCVHSEAALEIVCENARTYATLLRPTTGRYFFWADDAQPMCRCPRCGVYSDSDQALILENRMIRTLKEIDSRATLAHLAYRRTLQPPAEVRPDAGIFLEFAPIRRSYGHPLRRKEARGPRKGPTHGEHLALLDENLKWFGAKNAQVLEYWLDASLFYRQAGRRRTMLPWNSGIFRQDLQTYGNRGIRHVTSFAVMVDGEYVRRFGEPPLTDYGQGLHQWR